MAMKLESRKPPDEALSLTAAACLFRGFSDPSRLTILQHLAFGGHRVVDLTERSFAAGVQHPSSEQATADETAWLDADLG